MIQIDWSSLQRLCYLDIILFIGKTTVLLKKNMVYAYIY